VGFEVASLLDDYYNDSHNGTANDAFDAPFEHPIDVLDRAHPATPVLILDDLGHAALAYSATPPSAPPKIPPAASSFETSAAEHSPASSWEAPSNPSATRPFPRPPPTRKRPTAVCSAPSNR